MSDYYGIENDEDFQNEFNKNSFENKLKDPVRQAAQRFQEQCYLMLNWEQISAANLVGSEKKRYRNFCQIEHKEPFEYNNIMFKKTNNVDTLFDMNSAQLSALVPEIRLYKEFKKDNKEISIELPFDDITNRNKVELISRDAAGRGGGVGLKSFSWKSLGTNPENTTQFGAKLVLHFQNIDDLFQVRRHQTYTGTNGESLDLTVSYADLILPQRKYRKSENEGSFTYDSDYFRIKVLCGWYVPDGINYDKSFMPKELLDALSETKMIFYLSLKNHELDFNDDGSVELTVNYIAYAESLMVDPVDSNILFPTAEIARRKKLIARNLQVAEDTLAKEEEAILAAGGGDSQKKQEAKITEELIKTYKEDLEKANAMSKEYSYQRIMRGLLSSGRIFTIPVYTDFFDKQLVVRSTGLVNYTVEDALTKISEIEDSNMKNSSFQPIVADVSNIVSEMDNIGKTQEINETEKLEKIVNIYKRVSELTTEDINNGAQLIKFFYLGDLLEVVLYGMFNDDNLQKQNDDFMGKKLKVLVGNLTFLDYGQLEDSGLVIQTKGLNNEKYGYERLWKGKRVSVNIADIPISLKLFSSWFVENIIDKSLEHMSFKDFTDSVINDLVVRAVSTECLEFAPRQKARVNYKIFSSPRNEKRDYRQFYDRSGRGFFDLTWEHESGDNLAGYAIKLEDMLKNNTGFKTPLPKQEQEAASLIYNNVLENFLFLYGSTENPFDLSGDYNRDRDRGIYHIYFGDEKGIVKKINFKREDIPYIREANIQNNLIDKKGPAKVLRDKYNATVEMIGNHLFDVGSKVHIVPTIIGSTFSSVSMKNVRDLGIGGYFDIISVESKIESGVFETSMDVRWTARGDGTFNIGNQEITTVDISEVRTSISGDRII